MTATREEMGGNNGGGEWVGFSGTSIKNTWTKPRWGGIRGGRLEWGEVVGRNGDNCT